MVKIVEVVSRTVVKAEVVGDCTGDDGDTGATPEEGVVDSAVGTDTVVSEAVVLGVGAVVDCPRVDWDTGAPVEDRVVGGKGSVFVSVTGHTVVETGIVDVTITVESAGQFVTVGAQLVIVTSLVV